ncbi:hypothetical protein HY449_00485 [Candidatus Pacearchaeota archaeon]|nr:hypothetical protein [Candidatus Pacearchaeota archaeon]
MRKKENVSFLEVLGHSAYMTLVASGTLAFLTAYGTNITSKRNFNPVDAFRTLNKIYEEIKSENKIHPEKFKQIFGPNGFADRNKDNIIDFPERVDAYRRMGYFQDILPIAGETEFPKPTFSQLERAVNSYEGENEKFN